MYNWNGLEFPQKSIFHKGVCVFQPRSFTLHPRVHATVSYIDWSHNTKTHGANVQFYELSTVEQKLFVEERKLLSWYVET